MALGLAGTYCGAGSRGEGLPPISGVLPAGRRHSFCGIAAESIRVSGLWGTSFGYIGNRYLVSSHRNTNRQIFTVLTFWPFLIMIGILVIVLGLSNKKFKSELLFTSGAWLLMGLYSARNIPLFAIVAAPLLAQGLDDLLYQAAARFKLIDQFKQLETPVYKLLMFSLKVCFGRLSAFYCGCGLGLGYHFDIQGLGYGFDPEVFPVAAVDWLEENPQEGEVFNYFIWGGYLLYRQWPDMRVFIDGQTDFYGEALTRQYVQVINARRAGKGVGRA
jgi:hypothetical protein